MGKKLDIHISDTVEKIDLKIYEEDTNNKTIFTFDIEDSRNNTKTTLILEEKIAAILFEGLNNIFIEDDTEYQTDNIEDNIDDLEKFFEIISKNDMDFYGE